MDDPSALTNGDLAGFAEIQLLAALNHPTRSATSGGLTPVVLTCRADCYTRLAVATPVLPSASQMRGDGVREVLQDATLVQVEPLTPAAVRGYLLFRFPDPAGTANGEPRWRPILSTLTTTGSSSEDVVIDALRSPLRLFLAVDGYRDPASDPAELSRFRDAASLDAHLFARLIPAAIRQHSRPGGGSYTPRQVTGWLATLGRHLADQERAGRSGTDLLLHELWRAAGPRLPRYLTATLLTLPAAVLLPLVALVAWAAVWVITGRGSADNVNNIVALVVVAVVVGLPGWRASREDTDLRRFDLRSLRSPRGRRRFAGGLGLGLVLGLIPGSFYGVALRIVFDLPLGLGLPLGLSGLGLLIGFGVGLIRGFTQRPHAIESPRQLVAQGLTHTAVLLGLVLAFGVVLAFGFTVALAFGSVGGPSGLDLLYGLLFALVFVVMFGPALGLASSPWPRYLVTCLLLRHRGQLPARPARFLDWAYQAGILRLAGLAVQFRHCEFQAWLTTEGPPGAPPSREADAADAGIDGRRNLVI